MTRTGWLAVTVGLVVLCSVAVGQEATPDIPAGMREAFAEVKTIRVTESVSLPEGAPELDIGTSAVRDLLRSAGYTVVDDGPADAEVEVRVVGKARAAEYWYHRLRYSGAIVTVAVRVLCGDRSTERRDSGIASPPREIHSSFYTTPASAPFGRALRQAASAASLLAPILADLVPVTTLSRWVQDGEPRQLSGPAAQRLAAEDAARHVIEELTRSIGGAGSETAVRLAARLGEIGREGAVEALSAGLASPDAALRQACAFALMRLGTRLDMDTWTSEVRAAVGMVWVPPGEFMMGSADDDPDAWDSEKPRRRVRITRGFWLGKHTVTNAQYRAFCEATGREFPEGSDPGDDHPVVDVTWHDAAAYAEHYGLRLPTEAEWEYAARGPDGRRYPWGDEWAPERLCWLENLGPGGRTFPVGSFPAGASWIGALDMAGNVEEWVADWYDWNYYRVSPVEDPPGPATGTTRMFRSGPWFFGDPRFFRCARRNYFAPSVRSSSFGFRCARGL